MGTTDEFMGLTSVDVRCAICRRYMAQVHTCLRGEVVPAMMMISPDATEKDEEIVALKAANAEVLTHEVDLVSMLEQFTRQTKCRRHSDDKRKTCRKCVAKALAYKLCAALEQIPPGFKRKKVHQNG